MSTINKINEYIKDAKLVVLATASKEGVPSVRTLASFASDDINVYFSTGKQTQKVAHIKENPNVTLLFQHEGQDIPSFKNVSITGEAKVLCCSNKAEKEKAIALLSQRSERFKEKVEKGELNDTAIYKVTAKSIKYLDFTKGIGPNAVEEIAV